MGIPFDEFPFLSINGQRCMITDITVQPSSSCFGHLDRLTIDAMLLPEPEPEQELTPEDEHNIALELNKVILEDE